jgi:hypothetical protein
VLEGLVSLMASYSGLVVEEEGAGVATQWFEEGGGGEERERWKVRGANGVNSEYLRDMDANFMNSLPCFAARFARRSSQIPVIWRVEEADKEDVWGDRLEDDYGPPRYVSFARNKSRQTCCVTAFDIAADLSEYLVSPSPWAFLVTLVLKLRDLSLVEARCLVETDKDLIEPGEREELSRVMLEER